MTWPAAADVDAAHVLERIARRLRVGSLRIPVAVDPADPAMVLAAVLLAVHADHDGATGDQRGGGA